MLLRPMRTEEDYLENIDALLSMDADASTRRWQSLLHGLTPDGFSRHENANVNSGKLIPSSRFDSFTRH